MASFGDLCKDLEHAVYGSLYLYFWLFREILWTFRRDTSVGANQRISFWVLNRYRPRPEQRLDISDRWYLPKLVSLVEKEKVKK